MSRVAWVSAFWAVALLGSLETASCGSKAPVEQCFVAGDEDGNGLADCEDSVCWRANGSCKQNCESDTEDQDADGLAGCMDPNCWVKGGSCTEVCDSGKDEDGDGKVDCGDSDCATFDACVERCTGGKDEDLDGAVDCADSDCWTKDDGCKELCSGGADEDGDGLLDCDDLDCKSDVGCVPTYSKDVLPIFAAHCGGGACHIEGIGAGGWSLTKYDTLLKPAIYCSGETKGWCALFRIKEGSMPKNCPGCVTPAEVTTVTRWVDGGTLP